MTPSVRTLKGSKTKGFRGSPLLALGGQTRAAFPSPNILDSQLTWSYIYLWNVEVVNFN